MAAAKKATENEAVTFYSKYAKLRVVVVARSKMLIDGRLMNTPGKTAEFNRGEFTTSDPEVIEFLRNDRSYGIDYFESQADLAATVQPERDATADDELEVTRPRTRAGQRAAVNAKVTTPEDVESEDSEEEGTTDSDETDE